MAFSFFSGYICPLPSKKHSAYPEIFLASSVRARDEWNWSKRSRFCCWLEITETPLTVWSPQPIGFSLIRKALYDLGKKKEKREQIYKEKGNPRANTRLKGSVASISLVPAFHFGTQQEQMPEFWCQGL